MKTIPKQFHGFSLVELMVALTLGMLLSLAIISIYLAQTQSYKATVSQSTIQNAENAIAALVTPLVRSTGFAGCAPLPMATSGLIAGGPPPLGNFSVNSPSIMGYDAKGTAGNGSAYTIASDNSANDATAADWKPALDATLTGQAETGSDVLVLLSGVPDSNPVAVTSNAGASTLTVQDASSFSVGQIALISDCLKSSIFQITKITGLTITHAAGSGALANKSASFPALYPVGTVLTYFPGSQMIPLQQTALFVGQGLGDQSALMRATYSGGAWTTQILVPGVESMQVLYGTGTNGVVTQYVDANTVADWTKVYAIRMGFLIQGQLGSGTTSTAASRQYTVLGTTVTVPADNRLRHVYEMTVNLRNVMT